MDGFLPPHPSRPSPVLRQLALPGTLTQLQPGGRGQGGNPLSRASSARLPPSASMPWGRLSSESQSLNRDLLLLQMVACPSPGVPREPCALRNAGTEMTKTSWGRRQDLLASLVSGPRWFFHRFEGTRFPEPFASLTSVTQKAPRLCVLLAHVNFGILKIGQDFESRVRKEILFTLGFVPLSRIPRAGQGDRLSVESLYSLAARP